MHDKPQYSVTLLPGNEVRLLSLSRTAKVNPGNFAMRGHAKKKRWQSRYDHCRHGGALWPDPHHREPKDFPMPELNAHPLP